MPDKLTKTKALFRDEAKERKARRRDLAWLTKTESALRRATRPD